MRVGVSWLREYVDVPDLSVDELEHAFVRVGLEVEEITDLRALVTGPLVVGRVEKITELAGFKKPIRHVLVDAGETGPAGPAALAGPAGPAAPAGPAGPAAPAGPGRLRSIVCGATNFAEGDAVVVALPGAVLPVPGSAEGFRIGSRKTYGHLSEGMICSARELGVSDEHGGIIVLPADIDARPGDDARPLVGLADTIVELNITPDRGYCFSVRGLARELSHALGLPLCDPAAIDAPGATGTPAYPVTVRDTVGCDRFAARLVRGIDPAAPSPAWMRGRLHHAGVRSISLAVDITNYLMLELGQPMHAFDPDKLRGPLLVRRAVVGEKLTTLDGVSRVLDPEDMVICDTALDSPVAGEGAGVPISLAAVMGGENSEMAPDSTSVLFEAAHWDPVMVARTARRHRLSSEAAKRWERGVDPALALVALERAVTLLTEYAGGETDGTVLDLDYVVPRQPITIDGQLPSRLAGVAYPTERAVELLEEVGCTVTRGGSAAGAAGSAAAAGVVGSAAAGAGAALAGGTDTLVVTPPSWRPDLTDPADLVEEVVRLDGYDKVPSVLPVAPPGNGLTATQRRRRTVARALAEAGYVETLNYPFVGQAVLDTLLGSAPGSAPGAGSAAGSGVDSGVDSGSGSAVEAGAGAGAGSEAGSGDRRRSPLRLANPISEEEPALRTTLLPPLLAALRRNLGRGHRDLALYEIGMVFLPRPGGDGATPPRMAVTGRPTDAELAAAEAFVPEQPWHVAAVLAGEVEPAGWWGDGRPANWADAVESARVVLAAAGVPESLVEIRSGERAPWHPGRCAEVLVAGEPVGYAGELHPAVLSALDLPRRSCAMELTLDALPLPGAIPAPRISSYPPALIDVALVVAEDVPAAQVQRALRDGAGDLLEAVRLFDVYTNPAQLGEGRKSLAYKLTFRAPDRTLTVDEAVAARDAAVAAAGTHCGAILRGGA